MSDSEEDFASADEGDVESTSTDTPKVQAKESATTVKKEVESNIVETADKGEIVTKSDTSVDDTQKQSKKDSKVTEKGMKGPSGRGHGKELTKPKVGAAMQESSADEKSKQKPKSGKGKKGKQKGGKGKSVQSEGDSSLKREDCDRSTGTVNEKSDDLCKGAEVKVRNEKKTENVDEILQANKSIDIELKNENRNEKETENCKDLKLGKGVKVTSTPSDKDTDLERTPKGKNELVTDSSESSTLEQKANMIKSPSSQSITRPDPDHTEKQDAVLNKLAEAAKDTKSGWGWGWGSSLLEVASTSVSTFTSQVGDGLHTMMETVESTLNVPNPEELAEKTARPAGDLASTENTDQFSDKVITQKEDLSQNVTKQLENADGEPTQSNASQSKGKQENQSVKSQATADQTKNTENTETQSSEDGKTVDNQSGDGWFSAWGVSNITKMVEHTGKSLVSGSLDVLETLGKKTFDVINEHDPGLKKARGFLHDRRDKPNLSALLRDAKEQHEVQVEQEKETEEARKAHFGSLFDDFQGLAHLEALEMLSNQSEKKVNVLLNALPAEAIGDLKPKLLEIKHNFEIGDEDEDVTEQDFAACVTAILNELNVGTTPDKLLRTRDGIEEKLAECCDVESKQLVKGIHQLAISSLAELTSKCIEQFHKAGEMILIQKPALTDCPACSSTLLRLTKVLTAEVGILSTKFVECLNKQEGDDELKVNQLVTNIYLEASNSSSYVQDGFQLLLPVLQQAAIERSQEPQA